MTASNDMDIDDAEVIEVDDQQLPQLLEFLLSKAPSVAVEVVMDDAEARAKRDMATCLGIAMYFAHAPGGGD